MPLVVSRAGSLRPRFVLLALAVASMVSCTSPEPLASASDSATRFLSAWDAGDARAMVRSFDTASRKRWKPDRLRRFLNKARDAGDIAAWDVELTGEVVQPDPEEAQGSNPVTTSAPYSISYTSAALRSPVRLEGDLAMTYKPGRDAWEMNWDEGLLWPGIPGASAFSTTYRLPKRAPILDRDGRRLATGGGRGRRYPHGALAGATVGHLALAAPVDSGDAARRAGGGTGASGLEGVFDSRLRGTPSSVLAVTGAGGRRLEVLGRTGGAPGRALRTTLDVRVQRAAEGAYGATTGGAVIVEPSTGDLLAVVSSSPIDPNDYVGASDAEPFNRALSGLYPPGSAMKVVTSSAALDTAVVTPRTRVTGPGEYKGVRNFESGVFGSIPFSEAVQFSVNTAFAQVAEELGAGPLTDYARRFGFNRPPPSTVPAATSAFPFPEDLYSLMWGSIGQAQVLATPLEMATVAAAVANEGVRMEPRIALGEPPEGRRVVSRGTARTMTKLMTGVVEGGTGTGARISGVKVAGKTGTAEVDIDGVRMNHAWFICFAPAGAPKVAVAVVSELGGVGGEVAAPLARDILQSVLPLVR